MQDKKKRTHSRIHSHHHNNTHGHHHNTHTTRTQHTTQLRVPVPVEKRMLEHMHNKQPTVILREKANKKVNAVRQPTVILRRKSECSDMCSPVNRP